MNDKADFGRRYRGQVSRRLISKCRLHARHRQHTAWFSPDYAPLLDAQERHFANMSSQRHDELDDFPLQLIYARLLLESHEAEHTQHLLYRRAAADTITSMTILTPRAQSKRCCAPAAAAYFIHRRHEGRARMGGAGFRRRRSAAGDGRWLADYEILRADHHFHPTKCRGLSRASTPRLGGRTPHDADD